MVLTISSNDGPEFKKYTLDEFLSDVGIKHHYLAPYMLQQNGMAKRKSRKLMDTAQTM
jgi:transposase InsO family protein